MKKQRTVTILLWTWLVGGMTAVMAQQRPLLTEDVDLVKPGHVRWEAGFSFLQKQTITTYGSDPSMPFTRRRGDLARIGEIGIHIGLTDYVEFQIQGPLRNYFTDRSNTISLNDTGDFRFATKFKLLPEGRRLPAVGFRVGAILPNEKKLGTSTVGTFGQLLFGKHVGRVNAFANVGVIITDKPTELRRQSDQLLFGLGAIVPVTSRWDILGEVNGRTANRSPGLDDSAVARLGARVRAGGLLWDLSGVAGLAKYDAKSGIVFGVTYDGPVFKAATRATQP